LKPKSRKTESWAAVLLLSGLWFGMCADARAEATTAHKQSAYPRVQDEPVTRDKPSMTADEQAKLKKDLIDARDRQLSKTNSKR
jgi:hypothetical protein